MFRRIGYRAALTSFAFTALWLFFGLLLLSTPIPHALGIGGEMLIAWVLIFLAALGLSGLLLFIAAVNNIFPQNVRAPRSASKIGLRMSGRISCSQRGSKFVATTPGCRQLAVLPLPARRRASAKVCTTLASFERAYAC